MLKIGLTGGIASGKSTVCTLFENYNIPVIDADSIARQLVKPNEQAYAEIVQNFGQEILQQDKAIDRRKLRKIVFLDPVAKQSLENILHPRIRQQLVFQSKQEIAPYIILAIPLLVELNMYDLVNRTLVIDIEPNLQLQRLQQRDDILKDQAQAMINAQCDRKQRLAYADDVIDNNNEPTTLNKQVELLHQKYTNLSNGCQHTNSNGQ